MHYTRSLKLEQFCLHVIVTNLERFIYSRNVPQKNIDFLLRVYSEEVFKRFSRNQTVSEDCMLWFLNRHSKKYILPTVTEKVIKKLQIVGLNATSLSLRKSSATEYMINSIVCCVPNVTYLDLSKSKCSDKTLVCIKRMCPALISLDMSECEHITDDGIQKFCNGNLSLRNMNLIDSGVEECGLYYILNHIPQIECLKYYDLVDSLYEMKRQSELSHARYNLTELIYESPSVDDPAKVIHAWTVLCPNVRKVRIDFSVSEKLLRLCSRFQKLEDFEIVFEKDEYDSDNDKWYLPGEARPLPFLMDNDHTVNYAKNVIGPLTPIASNLTVLKLSAVEISTKTFIEKFHNLKTLGLQNVTFTEFTEGEIVLKENNLETLVIKNVGLYVPSTSKAVELLLSLSINVTKLHLTCLNHLPLNVLDVILNSMKKLAYVDFSNTSITIPSASRFLEIPSMTEMYFYEDSTDLSFASMGLKQVKLQAPANSLSWSCYDDEEDEYELDSDFEEKFFSNDY